MIVQFIEATQKIDQFNHGKFMVARFIGDEITAKSALPDYTEHSLWNLGGLRKLRPGMTLVLDLQTGEGAGFSLEPHGAGQTAARSALYELEKHELWVCPMFPPFLGWLFAQGMGGIKGDIRTLPRYVELDTLDGALYRPRSGRHEAADKMQEAIREALECLDPEFDGGNRKEADITIAREVLMKAIGVPV